MKRIERFPFISRQMEERQRLKTCFQILVSEHREIFAEVSEDVIATNCSGRRRLKLCQRPFAMSRSSESSCLASLFFDLPTTALRLRHLEVIVFAETPTATYREGSTILVTSTYGTTTTGCSTAAGGLKKVASQ